MYRSLAVVLVAFVGLAVCQYSSHADHGRANPCPDSHNHDYCYSLRDGTYWDPWNPYCGYIDCSGGVTYWRSCPAGTWNGIRPDLFHGWKYVCKVPIYKPCTQHSDKNLCRGM